MMAVGVLLDREPAAETPAAVVARREIGTISRWYCIAMVSRIARIPRTHVGGIPDHNVMPGLGPTKNTTPLADAIQRQRAI